MDRKEASVTAILEGVDYLKTQFNNHMTDETNQVNEAYDSLRAGGLTSRRIDEIFGEIKTRINNLKQEFDTVETNIRNDLTTSAETIDTADKNILDTLNQGNQ